MIDLVLIHPPVTLPTEPPVGLVTLAGALRRHGVSLELVDANVEALDHVLRSVSTDAARSVAQRRALQRRDRALDQLRGSSGYDNRDRHHSAVTALRQTLALTPGPGRPDLADYHDTRWSPLRMEDLRCAAAAHEESPYAGYFDELVRRVQALGPSVVGVAINYLHQVLPAMALFGLLRRRLPGVRRMAGGGLLGCWRHQLDSHSLAPVVDELVFDDGVPRVLEALGRSGSDRREPERGQAPDCTGAPWALYLAPGRIVPMHTTRGCFWSRCRYCPEATVSPRFEVLHRGELARVATDVAREHGASLLHFTDSALPPSSLRRLVRLDGQVPWYGFTRFHRCLTDPDLCAGLRRAGCVMLQLGLESGSPEMLGRLNKGIDLAQASVALRTLARAGIASYLYVMFGIPGEDQHHAEQTLSFVVQHASVVRFLNVALLNMPRGASPDALVTRPLQGQGELSLYVGFVPDEGLDRRQARRFMERTFQRQPQVAAILRRTPHVLGASHAPFFVMSGS